MSALDVRLRFHLFALVAILALTTSCGDDAASDGGGAQTGTAGPVAEESVPAWKKDLLDVCFQNVSRFPLPVHEKNRSQVQHELVESALSCGLRDEARRWASLIPNWRQGQAMAQCALRDALRGVTEHTEGLNGRARSKAQAILNDSTDQGWRARRALDVVAITEKVLAYKGDIPAPLIGSELPSAQRVDAFLASPEDARAQLGALETDSPVANPDIVLPQLDTAAAVYERFYEDESLRERIQTVSEAASAKLPFQIQFEARLGLAEAALSRGDQENARRILKRAEEFALGFTWQLPDEMRVRGQLGRRQARAGDLESAQAHLDEMLRLYDAKSSSIYDVFRAACLRETAELCMALDRRDDARDAFDRALDAAVLNPNSRPRAFDLTRICTAMVRQDFEPDAAMKTKIDGVAKGLGKPW